MEALILYFVLFFPGIGAMSFTGGAAPSGAIPFSAVRELGRTLTYTLPSLALLWYLVPGKSVFPAPATLMPRKRDLAPFAAGFAGLILTGLGTSFLSRVSLSYMDLPPPPESGAPSTAAGWVLLVFSCLGTGYLEESYFRYYLLTTPSLALDPLPGDTAAAGSPAAGNTAGRGPSPAGTPRLRAAAARVAFSTALFSLCHAYEGPWGVLNAALAGVLLSVLFLRSRPLHGIAWAHGAYNVAVYAAGMFFR